MVFSLTVLKKGQSVTLDNRWWKNRGCICWGSVLFYVSFSGLKMYFGQYEHINSFNYISKKVLFQEIICNSVLQKCRGDTYKFHSAGREDMDVWVILLDILKLCYCTIMDDRMISNLNLG